MKKNILLILGIVAVLLLLFISFSTGSLSFSGYKVTCSVKLTNPPLSSVKIVDPVSCNKYPATFCIGSLSFLTDSGNIQMLINDRTISTSYRINELVTKTYQISGCASSNINQVDIRVISSDNQILDSVTVGV